MDIRYVKKLIKLVQETGIAELEVKSGDESVRINLSSALPATPLAPATATHTVSAATPAPAPTASIPEHTPTSSPKKTTATEHQVKSPMVGTVYLAAQPGAAPFVTVGQKVKVGDTLCLIEAMKMYNKIEADQAGVISARLVENEQPTEYGQPLFIIGM